MQLLIPQTKYERTYEPQNFQKNRIFYRFSTVFLEYLVNHWTDSQVLYTICSYAATLQKRY